MVQRVLKKLLEDPDFLNDNDIETEASEQTLKIYPVMANSAECVEVVRSSSLVTEVFADGKKVFSSTEFKEVLQEVRRRL